MQYERSTLPEDLLLLGWDDEAGRNRYISNFGHLLAGAAILELALDDRVRIDGKRLRAVGGPTGNPALDLVLSDIRDSRRPRSTKTWVQRLGNRRGLKQAVLARMTERGVVRPEERRILGLFPMTRYPVVDRQRAEEVRRRVATSLTNPGLGDDVREAALASLVHPAGGTLLRRLVPREQRAGARDRARTLSKGEALSNDIAKAISDANAAVIASIAAASAAASSSSSSSSS